MIFENNRGLCWKYINNILFDVFNAYIDRRVYSRYVPHDFIVLCQHKRTFLTYIWSSSFRNLLLLSIVVVVFFLVRLLVWCVDFIIHPSFQNSIKHSREHDFFYCRTTINSVCVFISFSIRSRCFEIRRFPNQSRVPVYTEIDEYSLCFAWSFEQRPLKKCMNTSSYFPNAWNNKNHFVTRLSKKKSDAHICIPCWFIAVYSWWVCSFADSYTEYKSFEIKCQLKFF